MVRHSKYPVNHTKKKRRCCKCEKKSIDIIDGEYLCRIHSPLRKGYIGENN